MTEIELRPAGGAAPVNLESFIPDAARGLVQWAQSASAAYDLANRLVTTEFCPAQYKGKPDSAAAAMLAGAEVGLSPMSALRAFDVIQGVAAPRAITLRAIVQSMGHDIVIDEQSPAKVVARGRRKGTAEWQRVEWTISRAQQLGLTGKDQWKKQPQTMLIARATSEIARLIAADAILGIPYAAEELADDQEQTPAPAAKPTRVQRAKPAAPVEVEPEFDPPADPESAPVDVTHGEELITPQQMKKMQALFSEKGFKDSADRHDYVATLGFEVQSSNELTKAQAHAVIESLLELDAA